MKTIMLISVYVGLMAWFAIVLLTSVTGESMPSLFTIF